MQGRLWGICGALVLLAGCGPAQKDEPPAREEAPVRKAEVRRDYEVSASVAGDYSGPANLVMQDWRFSHLRLLAPEERNPVAFVFEQTKPVMNARGERQKLIVVATEHSVTDKDVSIAAVSASGGTLTFNGRFEDGSLNGALTIGSNPTIEGPLVKSASK